jgi:voltage-dependent anion channel protein 2
MSKGPVLFKDVGKRLKDLLTKDFPSEKQENKVEWRGKTSNGVNVESNLTVNSDGSVVGKIIPSYKIKEYNTNFTVDLSTKRENKVEICVEDKPLDGLKITVAGNERGDAYWGTGGVEFRHENGNFTASVDYGEEKGATLKGSLLLGTAAAESVTVGADAEYLIGQDNSVLKTVNTKLTYANPEFDIGLFCRINNEKDTNEVGVSYFHKINNDFLVGSEIAIDPAKALENKPKLVMATHYVLERDTVLKGKFDTSGLLGLSFSQKLNDRARVVVGSTIDTNNLSSKNSSKFGFTLSLNS